MSHLSLMIMVAALGAAPGNPSRTPAKAAKPAEKSAQDGDRDARDALAGPFFTALLRGEYASAMQGLTNVFAIGDGKRDYLAERMEALDKKLGRAVSYERLGQRRLSGSKRVVVEYYATYHPLKPVVWELSFYKAPATKETPERWMLTSLRFETEKVLEQVEGIER